MNIENFIGQKIAETVQNLYGQVDAKNIQLQQIMEQIIYQIKIVVEK